jgi:hypothetical protein
VSPGAGASAERWRARQAVALRVALPVFPLMGRRFWVRGEQESKDPALLLECECARASRTRRREARTRKSYVKAPTIALLLSQGATSAEFRGEARRARTDSVLSGCSPSLRGPAQHLTRPTNLRQRRRVVEVALRRVVLDSAALEGRGSFCRPCPGETSGCTAARRMEGDA